MAEKFLRRALLVAGTVSVAVISATVPAGAAPPQAVTGPSTETAPYVLPIADGVTTTSLLTVNDAGSALNGYELVGIPDGIGVQVLPRGQVSLTVNHELSLDTGIVRRHGERGAFVSDLVLDTSTNRANAGFDLIGPSVNYYDYPAGTYSSEPGAPSGATSGHTSQFQRFCSASLSDPGLFRSANGVGTYQRFRFANEEIGVEGRAFAIDTLGRATQLPRLGLQSWENTLAARNRTVTTLVQGDDDSSLGTITAYVGQKSNSGSPVARAGLTDGRNFAVHLADVTTDAAYRAAYDVGQPVPFTLDDIEWNQSGAAQEAEGLAEGVMQFNRPEDGAFDPNNPNDYYFNTTDGGAGSGDGGGGGLWRLRYQNIERPSLGGTLTLLLDGSEALTLNKPDNMTIDTHGNMLIQEDPGDSEAVSRIVAYRISDGAMGTVAQFDPAQFSTGGANFLTIDEESSGIIDAETAVGRAGAFYFTAQVHTAAGLPPGTGEDTVQEYVENGQLLRLDVSDFTAVYATG